MYLMDASPTWNSTTRACDMQYAATGKHDLER